MPVEGRLSALTVAGAVEAIWSGMGSNPLLWGRRETPVCGEHGEELPDSGVILGCHPLFGQNASPSPYRRSARFRCSVAALMRLSCEACDSSPRCHPHPANEPAKRVELHHLDACYPGLEQRVGKKLTFRWISDTEK